MLFSNAYQNQRAQDTLRLALIGKHTFCALCRLIAYPRRQLVLFMHEIIRRLSSTAGRSSSPTSSTTSRSGFFWPPLQVDIVNSMPLSHLRSRKPCSVKCGFQTSRSVTQNRSSGTRPNAGSSTRQQPRRANTTTKWKEKMTQARIPARCRLTPPICPRSRTRFWSQCMDRVVRATRARSVRSMHDRPFPRSLGEHIDYLLQAYEGCPEDPVVCMSLAIASLSRAMQRQADNRHHMIAQAGSIHSLQLADSEFFSGSSVHVSI